MATCPTFGRPTVWIPIGPPGRGHVLASTSHRSHRTPATVRPVLAPPWFGGSLDRPSVLLRLPVFARRRALDIELANGADPTTNLALALRARQLVARTTRDMFAFSLAALVREAARPPLSPGMAISLPRREITAARATLLGLAAALRAERPVYARGMALVSWLLTDGAGPAYDAHARDDLRHVLALAVEALDGGPAEAA
jgi:hypothetical protein